MNIFTKAFNAFNIRYIKFVYDTSKISYSGVPNLLSPQRSENENFIVSFWHEESYCLYPLLKGKKQFILTTKDPRGDYITALCNYFGYSTIRIPDNFEDGKYIPRIKNKLKEADGGNLVITFDGPLGPYHQPKEFPFFMGLLLNYKVLSISAKVKHKILLTKRWDNYIIPLPFNKLHFHFHEPLAIERKDLKDHFKSKREAIKDILEKYEEIS